jgi:hypothetical protein
MTQPTPPPVGTLLHATVGVQRMPLARETVLDPARAATETLAAYLRNAVFCVGGAPPAPFRLNAVRPEWPEDFTDLVYPAAGITIPTVTREAHALSPTMLEETFGLFGSETVLWKTAELAIRLQVDFWCTNKPERTAILAALPELFNPSEDRAGIVVQGPREYYDRTVRFSLVETERVDTAVTVEQRDRQLRALVLAEVDEVHLRRAVLMHPTLRLTEDLPPGWEDPEPIV